jgi:GntR family transcriptional regulator / MocR family aminotransferase
MGRTCLGQVTASSNAGGWPGWGTAIQVVSRFCPAGAVTVDTVTRATVDLHIGLDGRRDLCGQVCRQIRAAILDGRLLPGQALPSSRELAHRLALARNTVSVAYDRLVAEGLVFSRAGVGTFVSAGPRPHGQRQPTAVRTASPLRPRPLWDRQPGPSAAGTGQVEFDFRTGVPDAEQFPFATWRGLLAAQLRPRAVQQAINTDPAGDPGLRAALARHVGVSRGVRADADEILVTSGSRQAIDLLARVLLEPGQMVAVEDPGPCWPRRALASLGARVVGVPVDTDGLVVEAIPSGARMIQVCPSRQFPLGVSMSLPRRQALLEWAERAGGVIVEADYDSELHAGGRPLQPLYSLDHSGRVLYVGSLSTLLLPILRLGFLIVPKSLRRALHTAKQMADGPTPLPLHAAAAQFIDQGLLARHARRMRRIYAKRHHLLSATLEHCLADHLAPFSSVAGPHLAAVLHHGRGRDDTLAVERAAAAGVAVQALSSLAVTRPPQPGLLFGCGAIPTDRIHEGLRRLRPSLEAMATVA